MNSNIPSHNALYGTKTADNLLHAFEHEALSALRSTVYSALAQGEGDVATRRMLDEMTENGASGGELWLGYLNEIDDTSENLRRLSDIKKTDNTAMYTHMAQIAQEEGFEEIAEKFRMASAVQDSHSQMLDDRISQLNGTKEYSPDALHRCPVCGYTVSGNTPPDICPLCVREWK